MKNIVAFDLETTGLDSDIDAIIEIGVVLFNERRTITEWTTLINPQRSISSFITQLTGITNAMVANAPLIQDVIPDLQKFLGDVPVLGHNIQFDLRFAHRVGIKTSGDDIDTYDISSVLIPNAGRYNLSSLGLQLGIPLPATHRALDDARVTQALFKRLLEIGTEIPVDQIAQIVRIGRNIRWGGSWFFQEILNTQAKVPTPPKKDSQDYSNLFTQTLTGKESWREPCETAVEINVDEAAAYLEHGGKFSQLFPGFEYRYQQVEMLRTVARALNEDRHQMVEAGTGTGKSLAYLLPAALWAIKNNSRVIISTNTINLQDQLIHREIPDLKKVLAVDLHASVLKGRSNYVCPRRLNILCRTGPASPDEMRVLAKTLIWLRKTKTGDKAEINLSNPNEQFAWGRISADDENCSTETCLKHTGGACPFYQAHQKALQAHLLIVNHALLLADVATGNRILPEFDHIVIDEAHHLESATTDAMSFRVAATEVTRVIMGLGGLKSGIFGQLLSTVETSISPSEVAELHKTIQKATDLSFQIETLTKRFFRSIEAFLEERREGAGIGNYGQKERILPATRTQPSWTNVEIGWEDVETKLVPLIAILASITKSVAELNSVNNFEFDDLFSNLSFIYRRLSELQENINSLVFTPQNQMVYWVEIGSGSYGVLLHAAPLHIGHLMEKHIWHKKKSVILTSATLTTQDEFDYLRDRLHAVDAEELALGSPFDYETSTLVYLVNQIAPPQDHYAHQRDIVASLIQLCKATSGKTLVLFTSYKQLKAVADAISPTLTDQGIQVYQQGGGASPHALLESFRTDKAAVLLGTGSFWEGVDVPGAALSVLVIVKLPFYVPSDPVISARSESYEDPFYQYAVPEAILRFRQGFGRLIRTKSDRGIVVILDNRIQNMRYGSYFLESLPKCTVQSGPIEQLGRTATRWLGL